MSKRSPVLTLVMNRSGRNCLARVLFALSVSKEHWCMAADLPPSWHRGGGRDLRGRFPKGRLVG